MTNKVSKTHAEHNYDACAELQNLKEYDDWVVTTAFYSSIKFIEHSLFPGEFICPYENRIKEFDTFPQYINANRKLNKANPHRILENLISTYIEEDANVYNSYKDLKDACFKARYINYRVGKQRVKMCLEALELIKKYSD